MGSLVFKDRVKTTTTSTTSPFTLGSAATGYQAGSAIGDGNQSVWLIEGATASEWEVMIGTYATSGTTLTRVTTLASSTGSAVTFSAGTQTVSVVADALAQGVSGAFGMYETSVTGTATAAIGTMHVCSGTTSDYTVTLPAASGNAGRLIGFRMASGLTKLVTIDGNASETIDGAATRIMWAGESAILLCDGSNWFKISGKTIPIVAQMTRDAAQSIANTSVDKIAFDAIAFNSANMADATTNDRFDIKRDGKYLVSGSWYVNSSGSYMGQSRIHISGSEVKTALTQTQPSLPIISEVFDLASGAYVELHVYQASGGSQNTQTSAATRPRMTVTEIPVW